jgi:hypothetical protein
VRKFLFITSTLHFYTDYVSIEVYTDAHGEPLFNWDHTFNTEGVAEGLGLQVTAVDEVITNMRMTEQSEQVNGASEEEEEEEEEELGERAL